MNIYCIFFLNKNKNKHAPTLLRLRDSTLRPKSLSKQCNCLMKWKLGATSAFRERTKVKASSKLSRWHCMRYATVTVTERLIPATQCTRTPQLDDTPSSTWRNKRKLNNKSTYGTSTVRLDQLKSKFRNNSSKLVSARKNDYDSSNIPVSRLKILHFRK